MLFEELLELQKQVGTKTYVAVQAACMADKHRSLEVKQAKCHFCTKLCLPVKGSREPLFDDLSGK